VSYYKKLKILHINTDDYGGAGIAALRLHKALLNSKIDSSFLCLNKINEDTPNCQKFLKRKAHWLFRLLHRLQLVSYAHELNAKLLRGKNCKYEIFSFPATDYDITNHELVKEADIIHLHWIANFIDWHSFFKKVNKPILWTLHDENPFLGGFHYSEDMKRNEEEFYDLDHQLFSIKFNAVKHIKQIQVLCPSNWIKQQSMNSLIFGKYPHFVIPNSVPVETFRPLNKLESRSFLNIEHDRKVILFVATSLTNPRKGFELLLNVIHRLDSKLCSLAIVGGNSSHSIFQDVNIYNLGQISDEAILAKVYSAADLFVIPSIEDNLPNTMIESLACGTPVVGFNIGGIPDAIFNGFNGFIADKTNSDELYHAIFKALNYEFDNPKIAADARKRFGPELQIDRCIDLYRLLSKY
jgi:glycosyltransferase involved in cell wall biosynthesis